MKAFHAIAGFVVALLLLIASLNAAENEVRPFISGSWQAIRAEHQTRPTIIHFWGLTCGPCRVEMPEWGKLVQENPPIDIITIHAERMPPNERPIKDMLGKAGLLNVDNWMFADGFLERLRYEIDPQWRGELPMTLLIARDGSSTAILGPADFGAIRNWVLAQTHHR